MTDHPFVLNPEAIGDPRQTPVVQLADDPTPDDDTPCGRCGHPWDEHNHFSGYCLDGWDCDDSGWFRGPDGCECVGWEEPT